MKKLIAIIPAAFILFAILMFFSTYCSGQNVNGTLQRNVSGGAITGLFGSVRDTLAKKSDIPSGIPDSIAKKANRTFDNVANGAVPISKLSASTISGVNLGGSLANLSLGYGLTGTAYNGGTARTFAVDTTSIRTVLNSYTKAQTQANYLPKSNPAFTGTLTGPSATIAGNITANGTGSATITLNALAADYATIQDDDNFDRIWFETTGGYRTLFDIASGGSIQHRDAAGNILSTFSEDGTVTFSGNISAANLASGTYTPTLANAGGATSSSVHSVTYTRVGNIVKGTIILSVTTTGAPFTIGISLVYASNFTSGTDAVGFNVSTNSAIDRYFSGLSANATTDVLEVTGEASAGTFLYAIGYEYVIK